MHFTAEDADPPASPESTSGGRWRAGTAEKNQGITTKNTKGTKRKELNSFDRINPGTILRTYGAGRIYRMRERKRVM